MEPGCNVFFSFPECTGQNEDRINAAHFGIERNWLRSRGRCVHQRLPTRARTSKSAGLNQRMPHELRTDFITSPKQQGEDSLGKITRADSFTNCQPHKLGGSRMRAMGLDDDWISRCQCRSRVSARN